MDEMVYKKESHSVSKVGFFSCLCYALIKQIIL